MPIKISAGLLMYRFNNGQLELLLGHPGGPCYTGKDDGYWGIPKGETENDEPLRDTAIREFTEETGLIPHIRNIISLGSVLNHRQKLICIWAFQGDCDIPYPVNSNLFQMEWPKGSGCIQSFPEMDKIEFFSVKDALAKVEPAQREFILRVEKFIALRMAMLRTENYQAVI